MRIRSRHTSLIATALLALVPALLPGDALAAGKDGPVRVVATIVACGGESLTIAADIAPASSADLGPVRRARLHLKFEAAPLFGRMRKKRELDLGRTTSARRAERFSNLRAQSYTGIVRYRWVRGSRTVLSGIARTQKARVGGHRGKAACSIKVGRRPVDTKPPIITPVPNDQGWKRGPLEVRFFVFDDLSGVKLVVSRVDGGPFVRGRAVTVSGEGSHTLEFVARDAAGNQTPTRSVTLRIDEGAPSVPGVTSPAGSTTDTTPDITWNPSTDSASGVTGYVVLVRDSGGTIVWSQEVPAGAPPSVTVGQTLDVGSYVAEVVAHDGAEPEPFTATGNSSFSVVAG
jgi:hypothetical protein